MAVEFSLVVGQDSTYAENIHVRRFESTEQDPFTARQLKALQTLVTPKSATTAALSVGQSVPDFKLIDQERQPISLASLPVRL